MSIAKLQSLFYKVVSVLFLLIIFIPPVKMFFSPENDWSTVERRKLAERPRPPHSLFDLPTFFSGIEAYLGDHFGYREFLIKRYHREMKKRFGKIAKESKVLLGVNGWYFYSAGKQMEDYMGNLNLSEKKLNTWVAERRQRAMWCRERGIEYLLVIPPNKHTIYPEFLPSNIASHKGTSRLEQLADAAKKSPLPFLVDLSLLLRKAKDEQELFYKTDTHWNLRGAFIGFTAIVKALQERFGKIAFTTEFTVGPDVKKSCEDTPDLCDLARMAMQQKEAAILCQTLSDFEPCAQPDDFGLYGFSNLPQRVDLPSFARGCEKRQLTALVFRDSFFNSIEPFFSENFRHVVYLWKTYNQDNIEEALKIRHIDVIIEEVVERFLFDDIHD